MNLDLSMSRRKSRGELAAIFARLPAKNQARSSVPLLRRFAPLFRRCIWQPDIGSSSQPTLRPIASGSHPLPQPTILVSL